MLYDMNTHIHLILAIICSTPLLFSCTNSDSTSETGTSNPPEKASPSTAKPLREGYEAPFPMREYWDSTGKLKFEYEMRYGPNGKVARNGWSSAYYADGAIEREGAYLQNERIGTWTYYSNDGSVDRTENRGGQTIWTGPNQAIPTPGTEE